MSDPSEQPSEERGDGRPKRRRSKRSVSPPAFAAVLLAVAIGGVLGVRLSQNSKPESLKKMVAAAILVSAVMIIYPLVKP